MADKDSVQGGDKLGYAGVDEGVTAKDRKLLQAFHELHMDPDIESVEDLKRFMKKYKGVSTVKEETDQDELEPMKQKDIPQKQRQPGATCPTVSGGSGFHLGFQLPKISNFHGEPENQKKECHGRHSSLRLMPLEKPTHSLSSRSYQESGELLRGKLER